MATRIYSGVLDSSTLADWKSWSQEISNALSAFGWIQTSDTGQVNWSTIGAVPATGATTAYEIWKMPTVSGLFDVYLRINYSASEIDLILGVGTNGAGVLSSPTTLQVVSCNVAGGSGNIRTSGSTNRFCGIIGSTNSGTKQPGVFAIERSHDANGNDTNSFVVLATVSQNQGPFSQLLYPSGAASLQLSGGQACLLPAGLSTGVQGTNLGISPVFPWDGIPENPMTSLWAGYSGDIVNDAQISVTIYGQSRTLTGVTGSGQRINQMIGFTSGNGSTAVLVRYD